MFQLQIINFGQQTLIRNRIGNQIKILDPEPTNPDPKH